MIKSLPYQRSSAILLAPFLPAFLHLTDATFLVSFIELQGALMADPCRSSLTRMYVSFSLNRGRNWECHFVSVCHGAIPKVRFPPTQFRLGVQLASKWTKVQSIIAAIQWFGMNYKDTYTECRKIICLLYVIHLFFLIYKHIFNIYLGKRYFSIRTACFALRLISDIYLHIHIYIHTHIFCHVMSFIKTSLWHKRYDSIFLATWFAGIEIHSIHISAVDPAYGGCLIPKFTQQTFCFFTTNTKLVEHNTD